MKKNTNYNLSGIAPSFVWANLSSYQQGTIELRYKITTTVDSRPDGTTKEDMFIKLSDEIHLTSTWIKEIYYTTKK